MAQLAATVYVMDPDTHQTVELAPGTSPEPRLAALVTNPAAWVDGKLPDAAQPQADSGTSPADADADADDKATTKKTAATRKSAASKPARGRDAADEGDSSGDE